MVGEIGRTTCDHGMRKTNWIMSKVREVGWKRLSFSVILFLSVYGSAVFALLFFTALSLPVVLTISFFVSAFSTIFLVKTFMSYVPKLRSTRLKGFDFLSPDGSASELLVMERGAPESSVQAGVFSPDPESSMLHEENLETEPLEVGADLLDRTRNKKRAHTSRSAVNTPDAARAPCHSASSNCAAESNDLSGKARRSSGTTNSGSSVKAAGAAALGLRRFASSRCASESDAVSEQSMQLSSTPMSGRSVSAKWGTAASGHRGATFHVVSEVYDLNQRMEQHSRLLASTTVEQRASCGGSAASALVTERTTYVSQVGDRSVNDYNDNIVECGAMVSACPLTDADDDACVSQVSQGSLSQNGDMEGESASFSSISVARGRFITQDNILRYSSTALPLLVLCTFIFVGFIFAKVEADNEQTHEGLIRFLKVYLFSIFYNTVGNFFQMIHWEHESDPSTFLGNSTVCEGTVSVAESSELFREA